MATALATAPRPPRAALVARVRVNVAIAGHQASTVFFSRTVSGIAAQATNWSDRAPFRGGVSQVGAGQQSAQLLPDAPRGAAFVAGIVHSENGLQFRLPSRREAVVATQQQDPVPRRPGASVRCGASVIGLGKGRSRR